MKKLIIVSVGEATGKKIAHQIKRLFGGCVLVETVLMSKFSRKNIQGDLILFTSEFIARFTLRYLKEDIPYLIASRVIDHRSIKEVISIPEGKEVLLVNDAKNSALEAIEQLNEIGLDHIKYYPVYPGCGFYPKLDIAVTPGEVELVPPFVKQTINIGTRILDIETIYDIVSELEIDVIFKESLVTEYIKDIVEISKSIDANRRTVLESEKLLEIIINSVEYGVALVSKYGDIIRSNSKFESILENNNRDVLTKRLSQLMESSGISLKDNNSCITKVKSGDVLIDIRQVNFDNDIGYIVTLSYTDKVSKLEHKIRRNYQRKKDRKLYTFDDYISVDNKMKKMLEKAKKFAKTDFTILIQGESGTGKEILAQGIHSNSYRRKNPFIPINITAISSTLLESELFGYEEGAFTGALKGGKMGLFEIANGGTLFVDEIGDLPLPLQARLLRVLEDKRIRRIGGLEEIPIDVRIIAATNKNLFELMSEGKFREDLFFRLNILPLYTLPLRNRKEDIRYLLEHFININFDTEDTLKVEDIFEQETLGILENYRWKGNVRELINLVEYLSLIYDGEKFDPSSLHYYMLGSRKKEPIILDINELWVLNVINKFGAGGIGRTTIASIAKEKNKDIGEGKIRAILEKFEDMGLVKSQANKKGRIITEKGIQALEYYD